jgi:hypothetical protein
MKHACSKKNAFFSKELMLPLKEKRSDLGHELRQMLVIPHRLFTRGGIGDALRARAIREPAAGSIAMPCQLKSS